MFKSQIQFRINGFQKRKLDAINIIPRIEQEIPKIQDPLKRANAEALLTKVEGSIPLFDERIAELMIQREEADPDPVFPNA